MSELFFADLVRETTVTNGTAPLILTGPTPGHRSFASAVPESEPFHYVIAGIAQEDEGEIGVGTIDGQGQLVRSALRSSAGAMACDFSEGLKTVALTVASDWFAEQQAGSSLTIADIDGLSSALDGKQDAGDYAATAHGHIIGDVSGLSAALAGKQDAGDYAPASHDHAIDDISGSPGQAFLAEDDRLLALTAAGEGREIEGTAVLAKRSAGGSFTFDDDLLVNGLTLGLGPGANIRNTILGKTALSANTTGDYNTTVGWQAMRDNISGGANTAIGGRALETMTTATGNVAIGYQALLSNNANYNTAMGRQALYANTSGTYNMAIGYAALSANMTGSYNVCIGANSGQSLDTGSNNTIIGGWSGTAGLANSISLSTGLSERFRITGAVARPASDNAMSLGEASYRFSEVFAGTGSINTSDERVKHEIGVIPDAWLDAWGDVEWCRYKFVDGNRWHIGLIAQRVRDAFAARGLDATEIGLLCYDAWDDYSEPEIGEDGEPTGEDVLMRPAGDRWGLRYEECLAMEAAWVRRELAQA